MRPAYGATGLPAFVYTADQRTDDDAEWDPLTAPPTRRHWHMIGNRRLQVQVANDGLAAVWDAADGGQQVGTGIEDWPPAGAGAAPPVRTFGPTSFTGAARRSVRGCVSPGGLAPGRWATTARRSGSPSTRHWSGRPAPSTPNWGSTSGDG